MHAGIFLLAIYLCFIDFLDGWMDEWIDRTPYFFKTFVPPPNQNITLWSTTIINIPHLNHSKQADSGQDNRLSEPTVVH